MIFVVRREVDMLTEIERREKRQKLRGESVCWIIGPPKSSTAYCNVQCTLYVHCNVHTEVCARQRCGLVTDYFGQLFVCIITRRQVSADLSSRDTAIAAVPGCCCRFALHNKRHLHRQSTNNTSHFCV